MAAPVNPYTDFGPWGECTIDGQQVPGIISSINGAERPEEWNVQRPTIASNAITVWRGTKLAENIHIVTDLYNADQYTQYVRIRDLLRPRIGSRPPTRRIENATLAFSNITRIGCRNVAPPKWDKGRGVWVGNIYLIQYSPPRIADIGAAKAPKPDVDPDAALIAQNQALLNTAKSLGAPSQRITGAFSASIGG